MSNYFTNRGILAYKSGRIPTQLHHCFTNVFLKIAFRGNVSCNNHYVKIQCVI